MPRYSFLCPNCGAKTEVVRSMASADNIVRCHRGHRMNRNFQAEGVLVGAGRRSYSKPIVSDSLAILPEQIPEHRRMFPNIEVTSEGQPVFDNYADHNKYLETCGFEKVPQKKKKRGKKIS